MDDKKTKQTNTDVDTTLPPPLDEEIDSQLRDDQEVPLDEEAIYGEKEDADQFKEDIAERYNDDGDD